mgnify:FL=1
MLFRSKVWYAPYQKQAYGEEEIKAVVDALEDGWLAPGKRTAEFEQKIAARFGKKYGLMVNSGSSANMLAAICAGITKGVEVITPACTFSTTVAPLYQNGANVVFCDIVANRYVPSVEQILEKVTANTKVIFVPNLLGNKINWKLLKEKLIEMGRDDITLVEDSCDTITYTPETDIATVSFYASHIITAGGTGGMVMFNKKEQYDRALQIRDWGRVGNNSEDFATRFNNGLVDGIQYDWKFFYCEFGYNFKACEMNAAFGLAQLEKLPKFEEIRDTLFKRYISNLKADPVAAKFFTFPESDGRVLWLAMPLACPAEYRIKLLQYLEENQVQTRVTMAGNILRHPIYRDAFPTQSKNNFPESDKVMKEGFLVGCHHGLKIEDVDRVSKLLIQFAKEHSN